MITMGFWLVLALLLDQVTKLWIEKNIGLHQVIPIIGNFFKITNIRNSGISFGLFQGYGDVLRWIVLAIALFVFILSFRFASKSKLLAFSFGSIVGGALGNLLDRFLRGGWVIDFLSFWDFAIFNVADSFVVTGAVALGVYTLFSERQAPRYLGYGNSDRYRGQNGSTVLATVSPADTLHIVTELKEYLDHNISRTSSFFAICERISTWFTFQQISCQMLTSNQSIGNVLATVPAIGIGHTVLTNQDAGGASKNGGGGLQAFVIAKEKGGMDESAVLPAVSPANTMGGVTEYAQSLFWPIPWPIPAFGKWVFSQSQTAQALFIYKMRNCRAISFIPLITSDCEQMIQHLKTNPRKIVDSPHEFRIIVMEKTSATVGIVSPADTCGLCVVKPTETLEIGYDDVE